MTYRSVCIKVPQQLKAVSLFSGCGGFDWGAQQAGVEIIWANDVDERAAQTYEQLFPEVEFVRDDIRNIQHFPHGDVLIGCYPCTGFSIAARRRAQNSDTRDLRANEDNFLYREFLRALRQIRPKFLFVENVKGMLTAERGWFLRKQMNGFRRNGYRVRAELLSANNFGVPQARERVFIVGVRSNLNLPTYEFPAPTHGPDKTLPFASLRDAIGDMPEWPEGEFHEGDFHGHYMSRNRKRDWALPSYTIVAHKRHVPLHPMGEAPRKLGPDAWELQGDVNRRLSWRECAKLQGLPEGIEPDGHLRDKYRIVGNAVPPAFGRELIKSAMSLMQT